MEKVKVRFVRFMCPGAFVSETMERPVDSSDPSLVAWQDNAYAFTLHEREDVIDGDTVYTGKSAQAGPTYYHPDSKVENYSSVRKNPKATDILLFNMATNGWAFIVWSRWGNWPQPFSPFSDVVLPSPEQKAVIGAQGA